MIPYRDTPRARPLKQQQMSRLLKPPASHGLEVVLLLAAGVAVLLMLAIAALDAAGVR